VPVEDELVLPADGVAERDVHTVVPCARPEHLLALAVLEQMERRRGDVHDQLRAGEGQVAGGRTRVPHVLAHGDADERLAVLEQIQVVARREVAQLVEHAVVRQEPLLDHRLHLAARAHRARVVEIAVEMRGADEDDDPARRERDLLERPFGCTEEAGPQQQVLGRIPRHRELGEDDEIRVRALRVLDPLDDQRTVPVEVADDRVDLCESETHRVSDYQSETYSRRRRIAFRSRSRISPIRDRNASARVVLGVQVAAGERVVAAGRELADELGCELGWRPRRVVGERRRRHLRAPRAPVR